MKSLLVFIVVLGISNLCTAEILPFTVHSLKNLEAKNAAKPWLLVLWSVDCAPCYKELALIKGFTNKSFKTVLVSTDPPEQRARVQRIIDSQGLTGFATWQYDDANTAALRYAIDPQWRGELPRSYFYRPGGKVCAVSGALTSAQLEMWFVDNVNDCESLL